MRTVEVESDRCYDTSHSVPQLSDNAISILPKDDRPFLRHPIALACKAAMPEHQMVSLCRCADRSALHCCMHHMQWIGYCTVMNPGVYHRTLLACDHDLHILQVTAYR